VAFPNRDWPWYHLARIAGQRDESSSISLEVDGDVVIPPARQSVASNPVFVAYDNALAVR
jgi:hypothetical protein